MFKCIRKFTIHPLFFFCLAWIVLTDSTITLLCVLTSVFLHECGHIFVYSLAHIVIDEIHLQPFGVRITVKNEAFILPHIQLLCSMAGPLINLACAAVCFLLAKNTGMSQWVAMFYVTNIFLGIFNLLPIMPLDGSRILGAIVSVFFGEYTAQIVCAWVSLIVGLCVLAFGIYVLIDSKINLSLCILAGYILICLAVKIYNLLKKRTPNVKS